MNKSDMTVMMRYVCRPALCLCAAAVLLSGCKIGKHYTRPDLELPQTLTMDGMVEDSASMADYPWEQVYPDTLLQGLIRQMLDYNKDLLMADATVREQAALKRIDLANLLPQIGLRVSLDHLKLPQSNFDQTFFSHTLTPHLSFMWLPLPKKRFPGGKTPVLPSISVYPSGRRRSAHNHSCPPAPESRRAG